MPMSARRTPYTQEYLGQQHPQATPDELSEYQASIDRYYLIHGEVGRKIAAERLYLYDSLFLIKPPRALNAIFVDRDWDSYATGFKEAADSIVQSVIKDRCSVDLVAPAVAYLYCHSLELRLKELLIFSSNLLGCPVCNLKGHELLPLWKKVRRNLTDIWGEGAVHWGHLKKENDAIEKRLRELKKIKEGFRYPDQESGKVPGQFSLMHLKDVINAIHIALDVSSMEIHERWDHWYDVIRNRRSGELSS